MSFDEIPENEHEGYPCECGGSITMHVEDGLKHWVCDTCDFDAIDTERSE